MFVIIVFQFRLSSPLNDRCRSTHPGPKFPRSVKAQSSRKIISPIIFLPKKECGFKTINRARASINRVISCTGIDSGLISFSTNIIQCASLKDRHSNALRSLRDQSPGRNSIGRSRARNFFFMITFPTKGP